MYVKKNTGSSSKKQHVVVVEGSDSINLNVILKREYLAGKIMGSISPRLINSDIQSIEMDREEIDPNVNQITVTRDLNDLSFIDNQKIISLHVDMPQQDRISKKNRSKDDETNLDKAKSEVNIFEEKDITNGQSSKRKRNRKPTGYIGKSKNNQTIVQITNTRQNKHKDQMLLDILDTFPKKVDSPIEQIPQSLEMNMENAYDSKESGQEALQFNLNSKDFDDKFTV